VFGRVLLLRSSHLVRHGAAHRVIRQRGFLSFLADTPPGKTPVISSSRVAFIAWKPGRDRASDRWSTPVRVGDFGNAGLTRTITPVTAYLDGRVAIVTGGGSGIGRAIAIAYAAVGARVVIADIDEAAGAATVDEIAQAGGTAAFVRADASSPDAHEALVADTVARYGGLHIACNNAGVGGADKPVGEHPIDAWDRIIAINLSGVFYGMRHQIPALLASGGGVIVNIASIMASVGFRGQAAYAAAKHGVIGLTRSAALEYARQGVRINAVGPGFVDTPLLGDSSNRARRLLGALHPVGRLGEAAEVAELVLWLSSPKASFVTGSYYPVDGGYLAQ
jgi:NAD(P)-dependent dehydrogenase (short-subunit alcohol dehydrogenase family)